MQAQLGGAESDTCVAQRSFGTEFVPDTQKQLSPLVSSFLMLNSPMTCARAENQTPENNVLALVFSVQKCVFSTIRLTSWTFTDGASSSYVDACACIFKPDR